MAIQAACPRCGTTTSNPAARFCARCGTALPGTDSGGPRLLRASSSVPPRIVPPIATTYPPPGMAMPHPGGRPQPVGRSRSGCGCLFSLLVLGGTLFAFRHVGPGGPPIAATPEPNLFVTQAAPEALPARPAFTSSSPASRGDETGEPEIRHAQVVRTRVNDSDDSPWRVRATVATGGRRRLLLAVYFVDSSGNPLPASATGSDRRAVGPSVGAWVDDPTSDSHGGHDATARTAAVDLPRPRALDDVRLNGADAQFSLFDDRMVEVARVVVPLRGDGSGAARGSANAPSPRQPR